MHAVLQPPTVQLTLSNSTEALSGARTAIQHHAAAQGVSRCQCIHQHNRGQTPGSGALSNCKLQKVQTESTYTKMLRVTQLYTATTSIHSLLLRTALLQLLGRARRTNSSVYSSRGHGNFHDSKTDKGTPGALKLLCQTTDPQAHPI